MQINNERIGDDTKAAARRSLNVIKKTKNTFCGAHVSVSLSNFGQNWISRQI